MTREAEGPAAPFLRHLSPGCSEQERNAKAVEARDILTAIQAGRDIDLDGVAVIGDLFLDTLPLMSVDRLNGLSEGLLHDVRDHGIRTVRVIRGALTLTHARVHGMIGTRLHEGLLVVQGPVNLTGTSFEQTLDWSHTAFAGPVDLSDAVLLRGAFCLRCLFDQSARFDRTAFGTHSRFHQSRFRNQASFERAGFGGLAEFLEVTFEQETNLSRTYFKQGAGFSGSRFGGTVDFSEALFEKQAFFTFAIFQRDAYFRSATFRAAADFSDADFRQLDDFSNVLFGQPPVFIRTKITQIPKGAGGLEGSRILYSIAALLAILTLLLIFFLRKG
ncbi:MAG: pentapeptide repeat-containing protein [Nitrospirae bacterium]|nr:pentapeptide repeat-containing protein [Nitrospirota bacterium]